MPVTPTYPGVYIEEIPSGVRTIVGVSTAVTAFVGYLRRGPMNEAVQLFSFADFERRFGGLDTQSLVSYAVHQFFRNGGTEAYVVRTAAGFPTAAGLSGVSQITLQNTGGSAVLVVEAANEGTWGDNLRLDVDRNTSDPTSLFNLTVTEYVDVNGVPQPGASEVFRNLSMDSTSPNFVRDKVNEDSKLISIPRLTASGDPNPPEGPPVPDPPASTGTVIDVSGLDLTTLRAPSGTAPVTVAGGTNDIAGSIDLAQPTSLSHLRSMLQSALRSNAGLERATVELIGADHLRILTGVDDHLAVLTFTGTDPTGSSILPTGSLLDILGPGMENVSAGRQQYRLTGGDDGSVSTATEVVGSEASKTGLYALEDVDIFNILCIPLTSTFDDTSVATVLTDAIGYCERRRAFMIVDVPEAVNEVEEIKDWVDNNSSTLRSDHAALYFPRVKIPDPVNGFRARTMPASGTMAGLYARTDSERGVWKAPAGTEAVLRGVTSLDYKLTDPENGTVNPLGINALRTFPVYGNISWGARTLRGADRLADEYKYIPVRRLALFIEESLYRGLQWVVFEPNDESLWAQIRLNVGAFMQNLFRQGAFQGTSPREAYFVKCDSETTTQNDINLGIVNIVVGFAPLKPAEFVVLKIQQMAGQIEV